MKLCDKTLSLCDNRSVLNFDGMLSVIKNINLGIRFILELCMLASFGYYGFQIAMGFSLKLLLGIGLPAVVAVIWGLFLSPRAKFDLHIIARVLMEMILFFSAAGLLHLLHYGVLAIILAITFVVNRTILLLLRA